MHSGLTAISMCMASLVNGAASQVPDSFSTKRQCGYTGLDQALNGCPELEHARSVAFPCSELKSNLKSTSLSIGCLNTISDIVLKMNESELSQDLAELAGEMPRKTKFECDECGSSGVPLLLKRCCDACVEWATNDSALPTGGAAHTWCSGCDARQITSTFGLPPIDWKWSGDYDNYTEAAVDSAMDKWIQPVQDRLCAKLKADQVVVVERKLVPAQVSLRTAQKRLEFTVRVETDVPKAFNNSNDMPRNSSSSTMETPESLFGEISADAAHGYNLLLPATACFLTLTITML